MKISYLYSTVPRFSDTDSYGVMHHSSYYKWFEEARFTVSKEILGFDEDLLNGKSIKFPVIESYCRYKNPIVYGELLNIEVDLTVHKSAKITFDYRVKNATTNKLCAEGKTVHMFLDNNNRICLNIPKWFLDKLKIKGGM
ncbi:MAG: acyl-CoA thioesterase [Clostridium sp.]